MSQPNPQHARDHDLQKVSLRALCKSKQWRYKSYSFKGFLASAALGPEAWFHGALGCDEDWGGCYSRTFVF